MEQHSPIQRAIATANGSVVESFSIWGLPGKFRVEKSFNFFRRSQNFPAQLLFSYPPKNTLNDKIGEFIVPRGVIVRPVENFNALLNSPVGIHITFIPNEESPVFCVCFTRFELLQYPSDLIQETSMTSIYSTQQLETVRVYCITTRSPDISLLTPIIQDLFMTDFCFKEQWIKQFYLKTIPLIPQFKYQSTATRLYPLLDSLKNLHTDQPTLDLLSKHAIIRLFSVTKIAGILAMVSSLLLNISVFLIGRNIPLVTDCALSLIPLLGPFEWEGVIIPYIPSHLYEFLESPLPSIFGTEMPTEPVNISAFVAPVEPLGLMDNIDKIFLNNEKTPLPIPYFEDVFMELKNLCDREIVEILRMSSYEERMVAINKSGKGEKFGMEVMKIMKERFYDKIIGKITLFCKINGPLTFKEFQEKFPNTIPSGSLRTWYSEFVMSQHFSSWWIRNKMSNLQKSS
ncbi:hypothetical protein EIN_284020 [Entamoeba invadens IP1]|uniref:cDENN domain-containing protein n=1 Tax=Entamoeba invadens IP1 TaxID=370355 RepID=L7FJR7_ENTIV|nr:hypothetical protein EIN_284020 [Entamoeba invadens IP1]ELP84846.1 hypothetical protein EIN_284020 [Entamoeba invadens IP1]|eukprot:XP_004184192.1 hypothetical protein EIN_284020 [Entamoeba invadens IP1]